VKSSTAVQLLFVCGCFSEDIAKELQNVTLADIRVVATLGVGGFGRVELVRTFVKSNFTRIACSVQNTKIFSETSLQKSCVDNDILNPSWIDNSAGHVVASVLYRC